jgi:hypothetical protein
MLCFLCGYFKTNFLLWFSLWYQSYLTGDSHHQHKPEAGVFHLVPVPRAFPYGIPKAKLKRKVIKYLVAVVFFFCFLFLTSFFYNYSGFL